jgi:hypothetical protein
MESCPKEPTLLEWSRMTQRNQLIFDKSNSVRSRTEKYNNHSLTLKLKNSGLIFINGCRNLDYMSLNSCWKINPNGSTLVDWFGSLIKLTQKPLLVNPNFDPNKSWILGENKVLIKPNMKENNNKITNLSLNTTGPHFLV